MEIKITVHIPDLAQLASAIQSLGDAIVVHAGPQPESFQPAEPKTAISTKRRTYKYDPGARAAQTTIAAAVPTAPTTVTPAPAVPVTPQPVVQAEQPAPVPTTQQTYTMEQLAVAATQLVDAGRREELVGLLGQFGVQALTALPKEQYGAFATALRQMGAKL